MMQFIKRLSVVGLYGKFDMDISFNDGVNIVYGVNGAGKTTMLHILANVASLDLERFSWLPFQSITLELSEGSTIRIETKPESIHGPFPQTNLWINGIFELTWPPHPDQPKPDEPPWYATYENILEFKKSRNISIEATYFPAFRTMREAWSSLNLHDLPPSVLTRQRVSPRTRLHRRSIHQREPRYWEETDPQTALIREIFGGFVPYVNYPSPRDIQRDLDKAIQVAINRLAIGDRSLLSEAFNSVFKAISLGPEAFVEDSRTHEDIMTTIESLLEHLREKQSEYGVPEGNTAFDALRSQLSTSQRQGQGRDDTTTRVLLVYEDALRRRDQNLEDAFATVRQYINAVNDFLEGKQFAVSATPEGSPTPRLQIRHSNGTLSQLGTLSSGERQVAGLIYSASHLAEGSVILVDEPELSLHIDWQQSIIEAVVQQLPSKQVIVCTHSPVIGAEYMDRMVQLEPTATESDLYVDSEINDFDTIDDL